MDKMDITEHLNPGSNIIVAEVVGYNIYSYCCAKGEPFIQAEIIDDNGCVAAYTDDSTQCIEPDYKHRKTLRYSFQRPFSECYSFYRDYNRFFKDEKGDFDFSEIEVCSEKTVLQRGVDYPEYNKLSVSECTDFGSISLADTPKKHKVCPQFNLSGESYAYHMDEIYEDTFYKAERMIFLKSGDNPSLCDSYKLSANEYLTFSFGYNATGMIGFEIKSEEDTVIYLLFDEVLSDGDVDFTRMDSTNVIKCEFKKDCAYKFLSFEPYTLKYLKIVALSGQAVLSDIHLIEQKHKAVPISAKLPKENEKLKKIYDAAVETYRQNAVDIYMDCPSRERAGWLCDSFFTARVEYCLTGESKIERNFLENFLLPESFEFLPEGMLPMCYPADHPNGVFIPNWAQWLVLELVEYRERTGDFEMIDRFKSKIYSLIEFLGQYENELGILENLPSWVFIEWSTANDFTGGVNFPSNMLYVGMLSAAAKLYNDESLIIKAEKIKEYIRKRSYKNGFFTDQEVRKNGSLVNSGKSTEVCQYYAFFFDIATRELYPELFETLVESFGPDRKMKNLYNEIYEANAFVGNYLRLDILLRYGYTKKVLENVEGYFYYMAERTGTLWENVSENASCNHGFASHVAYWLCKIFGEEKI